MFVRDWSVIYCCCIGRLLILINRMIITFCPLRLLKQQYWPDQQVSLCMLTQAHHVCDLLSLVVVVLNIHKGWEENVARKRYLCKWQKQINLIFFPLNSHHWLLLMLLLSNIVYPWIMLYRYFYKHVQALCSDDIVLSWC